MAEDRVQLKREETVGNELVLSDINPKTNTKSIDDPVTGMTLEKTIERLWNAINNKLSRYVNSVNGRTGVVVLDGSDVGLDKVDNVSFADIKDWVISKIAQEMGYKRIELVDSLQDLDEKINTEWNNDEIYANKPFYARHGYNTDRRGYIGYLYYDDNRLKHVEKVLDTIGSADNSIIYNEHVNDKDYSEQGRIGVNIWKYEDALKIYNDLSGDKSESGLYIDKSKITQNVWGFNGVYGNGDPTDGNAFLYQDSSIRPEGTHEVIIKIDGVTILHSQDSQFNGVNWLRQPMQKGDIVICNFDDSEYLELSVKERFLKRGMNPELMMRKTAIGQVTQAPTMEEPNINYVIEFYSLRTALFKGLKYERIHSTGNYPSEALGVDLLECSGALYDKDDQTIIYSYGAGVSGMNAFYPYNPGRIHEVNSEVEKKRSYKTILPSGLSGDIFKDDSTGECNELGSMFIVPTYSLCVIPYGPHLDRNNNIMPNWPLIGPPLPYDANFNLGDNNFNLIGLNLVKSLSIRETENTTHRWATNMSGLRVNDDETPLTSDWFGNIDSSIPSRHSGGLSVNVGDFLEIGSSNKTNEREKQKEFFYDEGKVNVRIDKTKGLYNVTNELDIPTNTLGVNLANGGIYGDITDLPAPRRAGGLHFIDGSSTMPDHGLLSVNTSNGFSGLDISNHVVSGFEYLGHNTPYLSYSRNVLKIKPYRLVKDLTNIPDISEDLNNVFNNNSLSVDTFLSEQEIGRNIVINNLYRYKQWDTFTNLMHDYTADPSNFDEDHVYLAEGQYFILDGVSFKSYFEIYSYQDDYDAAITAMNEGTDLVKRRKCVVLVKERDLQLAYNTYDVRASIYVSTLSDDLRYPDVDNNGIIDGRDATLILDLYSMSVHFKRAYEHEGHYYTDPEFTTPLVPEDYVIYEIRNKTIDPYGVNPIREGFNGSLRLPRIGNLELTDELYARADATRDSIVDGRDASSVLTFYSLISTGSYSDMTSIEAWYAYLRDKYGIYVNYQETVGAQEIAHWIYSPGVHIRCNEFKGITTNSSYTSTDGTTIAEDYANDYHNELSIKIADQSSGYGVFDSCKAGALRFTSEGFLAVRINDSNMFSAIERRRHGNTDITTSGTKGLHIYDGNILGIQLTPAGDLDNNQLCIDEDGCLRLSQNLSPTMNSLTFRGIIQGGTVPVDYPYDGSEDTVIELGPGLCFSPMIGGGEEGGYYENNEPETQP